MAVHDELAQLVMDSCQAFVDGLRGDQQQVGNALKRHRIIVEAQIRASNTKVRARRMVKKGMSTILLCGMEHLDGVWNWWSDYLR